jgi:hypothetical protein
MTNTFATQSALTLAGTTMTNTFATQSALTLAGTTMTNTFATQSALTLAGTTITNAMGTQSNNVVALSQATNSILTALSALLGTSGPGVISNSVTGTGAPSFSYVQVAGGGSASFPQSGVYLATNSTTSGMTNTNTTFVGPISVSAAGSAQAVFWMTNWPNSSNLSATVSSGPVSLGASGSGLIFTNSWIGRTNEVVMWTFSPAFKFTAGPGGFGTWATPAAVVFTNFNPGTIGWKVATFPSAVGQGSDLSTANLQFVVGSTGYSLWATNASSSYNNEFSTIGTLLVR